MRKGVCSKSDIHTHTHTRTHLFFGSEHFKISCQLPLDFVFSPLVLLKDAPKGSALHLHTHTHTCKMHTRVFTTNIHMCICPANAKIILIHTRTHAYLACLLLLALSRGCGGCRSVVLCLQGLRCDLLRPATLDEGDELGGGCGTVGIMSNGYIE